MLKDLPFIARLLIIIVAAVLINIAVTAVVSRHSSKSRHEISASISLLLSLALIVSMNGGWVFGLAAVLTLLLVWLVRRLRSDRQSGARSISRITVLLTVVIMVVCWGGSMIILTGITAEKVYEQLYTASENFVDQVELSGGIRMFYDKSLQTGRYGVQYEHPEQLEYSMIEALARNNSCTIFSNPRSEISSMLRDISYPMQTAVIFYDAGGNIIRESGDYIFFDYVSRDEWDAGKEMDISHYGWIDIGDKGGSDHDPYTMFRTMYSGTRSLYDINLLRITGEFDGAELKPVSMYYMTVSLLDAALDQLHPSEDTAEPSDDVDYSYSLSDLDRQGLLEWQLLFDELYTPADPKGPVTVYAMNPRISLYEGAPVHYTGWDRNFASLLDLTEEMDFPGSGEIYKYSNTFNNMNLTGLSRLLIFSGYTYRNTAAMDALRPDQDPREAPVDFYMVTAVMSEPLRCAVSALRNIYIWSGLLAAALVLLLRGIISSGLLSPIEQIESGMAEDWSNVRIPDDRLSGLWPEASDLYEYYGREQRHRQRSRDEITRLSAALDYSRRAEENRRQMTSAIAHELKTPLAVVHSYAEGLQEHIAEDKRGEYLATILSETERMDAMVLEMLDLSRLEAGKVRISRDVFSLTELTKAVFDKLAPLAEQRRLDISFAPDGEYNVIADEARIGQVVENFVSNAVRYTPEGGSISASVHHGRGYTEFVIGNTTERPFTAEEITKIWDTFYQTDKSRAGKGTGLGLAIAKTIIELHGGQCYVRNTVGGVEFSFRIPD